MVSEDEISAKYKKMYEEKIKYFKNELKQDWKFNNNYHFGTSHWWKDTSCK